MASAGQTLTGIADALSSPNLPWRSSQEAAAGLTEPLRGGTALEERLPPDVAAVSRGLRGQMRAAARLVGRLDADEDSLTDDDATAPASRAPFIPVRGPVLTVRANLNLRSESFRHAIRLAVALAVASVLFTQLPLERGYWVALTTLVVLRPDYRGTMSRGIERILGTLVGSVVATVIAAQLRPGPWTLVVLVGVFAFLSVATLRASYPIFAAFLTCYVVFLISLTGLPSSTAGLDRLIDTAVGGLLAMLAYRLWPTWESARTGRTLASLLESQGRTAPRCWTGYVDPSRRRPDALHRVARRGAPGPVQRADVGRPAADRARQRRDAARDGAGGGRGGADVRPVGDDPACAAAAARRTPRCRSSPTLSGQTDTAMRPPSRTSARIGARARPPCLRGTADRYASGARAGTERAGRDRDRRDGGRRRHDPPPARRRGHRHRFGPGRPPLIRSAGAGRGAGRPRRTTRRSPRRTLCGAGPRPPP